jgi:integrase
MGKRRGHGEGSIYQRQDGRWEAKAPIAPGAAGRARRSVYGRTRREVVDKLRVLQTQAANGAVPDERVTVEAHVTAWLKAKRATVRPGTHVRYEQLVRLHIVPGLGRKRLARLTPRDLQNFYGTLLEAGSAPRTVGNVHRVLHAALKEAAQWGLVTQNVAALVSPPRPPRAPMRTLTAAQAGDLLKAATDERLEALYVLALHTGMRKGELLGLRWNDVDLKAQTLHIQGSLQPIPGKGLQVVEVKTESSRRQIRLGTASSEALRRHRVRQAQERLRAGETWTDLDLVFPNTTGRPTHPGNFLRRDFDPLLKRAGVPRVKFHELRHTCATLLLGEGVHPKIVSELLGHSDITVTLNLYSHVLPTMQQQAVDTLDGLLSEPMVVKEVVNNASE